MNSNEIQTLLQEQLPGKYVSVKERKAFDGSPYIAIVIARSDYLINNVEGQYIEKISLSLQNGVLEFQAYGGSGGRTIYRKPNKDNESEKYLALGSEKMPAIRSKDLKKSLLKICKDYMEIVEKIQRMGLAQ